MSKSAFARLWLWPILLMLVTAFGLVTAFIGDGVWDFIGAAALLAPGTIGIALCFGKSLPK